MNIESIRNPYNDLRRERIIKRVKSVIKVLLVLLSLLLLFGCSKESKDDTFFLQKVSGKYFATNGSNSDAIYNFASVGSRGGFLYSINKQFNVGQFCMEKTHYCTLSNIEETSNSFSFVSNEPRKNTNLNNGNYSFNCNSSDEQKSYQATIVSENPLTVSFNGQRFTEVDRAVRTEIITKWNDYYWQVNCAGRESGEQGCSTQSCKFF